MASFVKLKNTMDLKNTEAGRVIICSDKLDETFAGVSAELAAPSKGAFEEGVATKSEILKRRLDMIDKLILQYEEQYWMLGDEMLYKKCKNASEIDDAVEEGVQEGHPDLDLEEQWKQQRGTELPHPLQLQKFIVDSIATSAYKSKDADRRMKNKLQKGKKDFIQTALPIIARLESSSHSSLCAGMNKRGAIAMLCGTENTYYIRSPCVMIGRQAGEESNCKALEAIDIDISRELSGFENTSSRRQARVYLSRTNTFILENIGKRPLTVDGVLVQPNEVAPLGHLSFVAIGMASFIFFSNNLT